VRGRRPFISDEELRIQTPQLQDRPSPPRPSPTSQAIQEFVLMNNPALVSIRLAVCETSNDAHNLVAWDPRGSYVQLWHIYFDMARLDLAAAMPAAAEEFPSSGFGRGAITPAATGRRSSPQQLDSIGHRHLQPARGQETSPLPRVPVRRGRLLRV